MISISYQKKKNKKNSVFLNKNIDFVTFKDLFTKTDVDVVDDWWNNLIYPTYDFSSFYIIFI